MKILKKIGAVMALLLFFTSCAYVGSPAFADVQSSGQVIVKFDTGANSIPVEDKHIKVGSKLSDYIRTEKYGYDLQGWQYEGQFFDFENTAITKSMTLTPKWALKSDYFTEDPLLYRDERFEDGYPKFVEENGKLYAEVKLKTAATVHMVFRNRCREVDVEGVLHGHFGIHGYEVDAADYNDYFSLSAGTVKRIELEDLDRGYGRLSVAAFVIEDEASISAMPTVITNAYQSRDVESSRSAFRAYSGYISQDGQSILVECSNDIDHASNLSAKDFSLTLDGKRVEVTAVRVLESPYHLGFTVNNLSELIKNHEAGKADLVENGLRNLQLEYSGSGLKDMAGNQATKQSFEDVWFSIYERPQIASKVLSPDQKRVIFLVRGTILDYIDGEASYHDGQSQLETRDSRWGDNSFASIYDLDTPLLKSDFDDMTFEARYLSDSYQFLDKTFTKLSESATFSAYQCEAVVMEGAEYNSTEGRLRIELLNHLDMSADYLEVLGCSFVLNADGEDLMLTGHSNDIYTYDGKTVLEFYLSGDLEVSPESVVTLKYKALHLTDRNEDNYNYLKNQTYQNVEELDSIPVFIQ
ncbi:MAG: hypothetical protein JXO44_09540 [Clostridia bacterium]|nr:hypothetical protein [Clostridia bacterium]